MGVSCSPTPEERVHLTVAGVLSPGAGQALQRQLGALAGAEVELEVRPYPKSLFRELLFRGPAEGAHDFDLLVVPDSWLEPLSHRGVILPLPPTYVETLRGVASSSALLAVSKDNQVLAYPLAAHVEALVYNPSFYPQAPESLEELLQTPLPPEVLPLSFALERESPWFAWAGSLASDPDQAISPKDLEQLFRLLEPAFRSPGSWELFRYEDGDSVRLQLFAHSRLASFVAGPELLFALEHLGQSFAITPLPPALRGGRPSRPLVQFSCLAVARSSPWPDLSLAVASKLFNPGVNLQLATTMRLLPVTSDLKGGDRAAIQGHFYAFFLALERAQYPRRDPAWDRQWESLRTWIQQLLRQEAPSPSKFFASGSIG